LLHFVFAKIIVQLNQFIKSINWFYAAHIAALFFSSYAIIRLILNATANFGTKLFSSFITLIYFSNFILEIQYTQTAFLLLTAGFGTLYFHKNISFVNYLTAITCITLGLMFRADCYYLAIIVFFPVIFYERIFKSKFSRSSLKLLSVIIVVPLFWIALNQLYYSGEKWREFKSYQKAITAINDYNILNKLPVSKSEEIISLSGWTNNDIDLIKIFFTLDKNVFSVEKFNILNNRWKWHDVISLKNIKRVKFLPGLIFSSLGIHILLFIFFILLPVVAAGRFDRIYIYSVYYYSAMIVLFVILMCFVRMPMKRVYMPILFSSFIFFYLIAYSEKFDFRFKKVYNLITILSLLMLIPLKLYSLKTISSQNINDALTLSEELTFLTSYKDKVFIVFGNALEYRGINQNSIENFGELKLVALGNDTRTPIISEYLEHLGISNFPIGTCNNNLAFIVDANDNSAAKKIKMYFDNHYPLEKFDLKLTDCNNLICIYDIICNNQ
jgi:hypothetical protein